MKLKFLKKIFSTIKLIFIGFILIISSCDENDMETNKPELKENYYLQYKIKGNGAYGRFSNWTATTPKGIYTNNGLQVKSWSQTYGPVNKGFKCEIKIDDYISGAPTIEIHISKNEEPFTLKDSETGESASYIIDF